MENQRGPTQTGPLFISGAHLLGAGQWQRGGRCLGGITG